MVHGSRGDADHGPRFVLRLICLFQHLFAESSCPFCAATSELYTNLEEDWSDFILVLAD